jgi:hypothetical protein
MRKIPIERCPVCGGEGRIIYMNRHKRTGDIIRHYRTGEIIKDGPYPCSVCEGTGVIKSKRMKIKALSIKQPWANMIADGKKTIETRTWKTNHRGAIAIVSSKSPDIAPAGYLLAIGTIVDCREMVKADEEKAYVRCLPGLYAWELHAVKKLDKPIPIKGKQGLYEIDIDELGI